MNIKEVYWRGNNVRFVNIDDEWFAVMDDLCKVFEEYKRNVTLDYGAQSDDFMQVEIDGKFMYVVSEIIAYQIMFDSRIPEAMSLKRWTAGVLQKLRSYIGLEGYDVMSMLNKDVQNDIDHFLDTIFYDEENNRLMRSVTVQGGDVDQVPVDFEPGEL